MCVCVCVCVCAAAAAAAAADADAAAAADADADAAVWQCVLLCVLRANRGEPTKTVRIWGKLAHTTWQ